jgi:hypothetical protein
VNHIESTSRQGEPSVEQRTLQKSEPHDTNAAEASVSLRVILADVAPTWIDAQDKHETPVWSEQTSKDSL